MTAELTPVTRLRSSVDGHLGHPSVILQVKHNMTDHADADSSAKRVELLDTAGRVVLQGNFIVSP